MGDWASQIVLVPKMDHLVLFCVSYRKVNAVSNFDAYPMPRVDKLFSVFIPRWIRHIGFGRSPCHHYPKKKLSQEKAFTTPFELHQFVILLGCSYNPLILAPLLITDGCAEQGGCPALCCQRRGTAACKGSDVSCHHLKATLKQFVLYK